MGLNKIEKYCILGVFILVLVAILCNLDSIRSNAGKYSSTEAIIPDTPHPVDMIELPKNIKQISKKYNAFNEIYNSDELLLVYGYIPLSIEEKENRIFHKEMNNLLKEKDINIKVLPYKNWRDVLEQAQVENGKDPNACTLFSASEKNLQLIIDTTKDCFSNACVIDAKNNKYASLWKNPADIVATIEKYIGKQE